MLNISTFPTCTSMGFNFLNNTLLCSMDSLQVKLCTSPMIVHTEITFIQHHLKVLGRFPDFRRLLPGPNLRSTNLSLPSVPAELLVQTISIGRITFLFKKLVRSRKYGLVIILIFLVHTKFS